MDNLISSVAAVATAIVGVALLAVLVSRNSNTAGVLSAGGRAFAGALAAAEGPVLGNSFGFNTLGNTQIGPSAFGF